MFSCVYARERENGKIVRKRERERKITRERVKTGERLYEKECVSK
jgi:hypothetical protein